jgi:hypothetical protein
LARSSRIAPGSAVGCGVGVETVLVDSVEDSRDGMVALLDDADDAVAPDGCADCDEQAARSAARRRVSVRRIGPGTPTLAPL